MKEFKIIKILDEYTLVINAGYNDSIKESDLFQIYVTGEEIIDPDTKESLGTLDIIKANITPITIYEKMSICKNTLQEPSSSSPLNTLGATMKSLYGFNDIVHKRLNVENSQITGNLPESDKIKIGDKVRKIQSN